jgi:aminobenzoyl-glutamate transport protein
MLEEKKTKSAQGGLLGWIERTGNKLPTAFALFLWLSLIVLVVSLVLGVAGVSVTSPTGAPVKVFNLISWEGLYRFSSGFIANFQNVTVLGILLVIGLATALCEKTGLFTAVIKAGLGKRKGGAGVVFIAAFIAVLLPTLAADAAFIVVPPILALSFLGMGRHPLAGLFMGYACAGGAITKAVVTPGVHIVLNPISSAMANMVQPGFTMSPTTGWWFLLVSALLIAVSATFVTIKFIEPRLGAYTPEEGIPAGSGGTNELSVQEKKALKNTGIALLIGIVVCVILFGIFLSNYIREWTAANAETLTAATARYVSSCLAFILCAMFALCGAVYGKSMGTIKNLAGAVKIMEDGAKQFASFIVLLVAMGQFLFFFSASNLGSVLAIAGGNGLKALNMPVPILAVLFVILCAFVNIFFASGISKWIIFAPIFVPMFMQLNISPAYTTVLYALGDNVTNNMTPVLPYFAILLTMTQRYDKKAGFGTIFSMQLPYSAVFLIAALVQVIVWGITGLPLGPGGSMYLN